MINCKLWPKTSNDRDLQCRNWNWKWLLSLTAWPVGFICFAGISRVVMAARAGSAAALTSVKPLSEQFSSGRHPTHSWSNLLWNRQRMDNTGQGTNWANNCFAVYRPLPFVTSTTSLNPGINNAQRLCWKRALLLIKKFCWLVNFWVNCSFCSSGLISV